MSLFFVQYSVIQLRYCWRNYILNNFSLFDSLLRLVCLLMAHIYFIIIIDQQNLGTFSDDICSWTTFFIFSIYSTNNFFFFFNILSFLFLQTFLLINMIFVCWLRWISHVMCHIRHEYKLSERYLRKYFLCVQGISQILITRFPITPKNFR